MTPPKRGRGRPRKNPPADGDLMPPPPPAKRKSVQAASGTMASGATASGSTASGSTASGSTATAPGTTSSGTARSTAPSRSSLSAALRLSGTGPTLSTPRTFPAASSSTSLEIPANIVPELPAAETDSGRKTKVPFSNVHKHFEQTSTGTDSNGNKLWTSKCKYCPPGPLGRYQDKSSSHLKTHLQSHHPKILQIVEEEDQRDRESKAMKELSKDKQGRVLDKYLNWIAFANMPLSTSSDPYFVEFYKELNDQVQIPGRKGTTTLLVKNKFAGMYQKLMALLDRVRAVHSTTDMWSNFRLRSSYIGFTGHMYDPLTNSRVCVRLALRPFNSSHTAENIIEEAMKIFEEFGIVHKVCHLKHFDIKI